MAIYVKSEGPLAKIDFYMCLRLFHTNGGIQLNIPNILECVTYELLAGTHEVKWIILT